MILLILCQIAHVNQQRPLFPARGFLATEHVGHLLWGDGGGFFNGERDRLGVEWRMDVGTVHLENRTLHNLTGNVAVSVVSCRGRAAKEFSGRTWGGRIFVINGHIEGVNGRWR